MLWGTGHPETQGSLSFLVLALIYCRPVCGCTSPRCWMCWMCRLSPPPPPTPFRLAYFGKFQNLSQSQVIERFKWQVGCQLRQAECAPPHLGALGLDDTGL